MVWDSLVKQGHSPPVSDGPQQRLSGSLLDLHASERGNGDHQAVCDAEIDHIQHAFACVPSRRFIPGLQI